MTRCRHNELWGKLIKGTLKDKLLEYLGEVEYPLSPIHHRSAIGAPSEPSVSSHRWLVFVCVTSVMIKIMETVSREILILVRFCKAL